jgi:hypothetical protein
MMTIHAMNDLPYLPRQEYGRQALSGLVLHDGSETTWLANGVLATPWWRVI